MKVLFIGGTGLISTSIARQLIQQGHQVTLFNRGKSQNRVGDGAEVIIGDRSERESFEKTFADTEYDVVVDMVAFHPDDTLSAIRAFNGRVKQFIHCSTVCVYSGPVNQIPTTETEPYHSIGSYGKNKILCEQALLDAHDKTGFPVTIMRPSHSYGEGGSVIRSCGPADTFIDRLRKGKPVVIQGDGNGLWAACHVDDVARGFIGVMLNDRCIGEAYNIAGDEYMTWNTYHQQVAEVLGVALEPVYIPTDTLCSIAPEWSGTTHEIFAWPSIFDNSKIKAHTNYTGQTVSFREGIRRTVAWLDSEGKDNDSDTDQYEDQLIASWRELTPKLPPFPKS